MGVAFSTDNSVKVVNAIAIRGKSIRDKHLVYFVVLLIRNTIAVYIVITSIAYAITISISLVWIIGVRTVVVQRVYPIAIVIGIFFYGDSSCIYR